jgi:hypothetical protein
MSAQKSRARTVSCTLFSNKRRRFSFPAMTADCEFRRESTVDPIFRRWSFGLTVATYCVIVERSINLQLQLAKCVDV